MFDAADKILTSVEEIECLDDSKTLAELNETLKILADCYKNTGHPYRPQGCSKNVRILILDEMTKIVDVISARCGAVASIVYAPRATA